LHKRYQKFKAIIQTSSFDEKKLTDLEKHILLLAKQKADERNQKMSIISELDEKRAKELNDFCNHNSIEYIPIDLSHAHEKLILGTDDPHWNEYANELIAKQLSRLLDLVH